jgi:MFS family permease
VFTLARFSEAFLVIRARDIGLALVWTPAVIAWMSLVYAMSAYPAGRLQDRIGARPLLLLGIASLIAADLVIVFSPMLLAAFAAIGLWGLHMGFTQGVLSALVAETAPQRLRGTAFGLFGLITGVAALLASVVAGLLWDRIGAEATFLAGAAFAAMALLAFLLVRQRPRGLAGKSGAIPPI